MLSFQKSETGYSPVLPAATRLGTVHYTVASLDRQVRFYQQVLGFQLHWREGAEAGLGAGGEDLLRLSELPGAIRARGTTGLYHTAFLVPNRWELAQLLKRIAETQTPIQGLMDHVTHHAIYLPDAEGNGIELAWDRPREQWPRSFNEMMRLNRSLPPQEIFEALENQPEEWPGLDAATQVGHIHLHVSQLDPSERFYREVLGFDIPFGMRMDSAVFFSAGGYHHHLATNIWQGAGAPPPPENATGLKHFTVVLPEASELERVLARVEAAGLSISETNQGTFVRDPSQNGIVLSAPTIG